MSILLDAIELPADLLWTDEYQWSPVTQSVTKSLTGALIIQEAAQSKGRPITLSGGDEAAWVNKSTLEALRAKVDQADLDMTLNYHGTEYTVRFRHEGGSPVEAKQVADFTNPQPDDFYTITLKLMEV